MNPYVKETQIKTENKHKKDSQSIENSDHKKLDQRFYGIINEFYKDCDRESAAKCTSINTNILKKKPLAVVNNFKPFILEKSLIRADMVKRTLKQKDEIAVSETKEFITLASFTEVNLQHGNKQLTSFTIKSEKNIKSGCHQEESIDELCKEQHNAETPKKLYNMELVNSILEDFSQSPLRKGEIIENCFWQFSPEYRLRNYPTKTYSRSCLNSKTRNLNQSFEEKSPRKSSEYSDDHSFCSSLSIQNSFGEHINNNPTSFTNTTNTEHLCENLLNLTEYFMENESCQNLPNQQRKQQQNDDKLLTPSQEDFTLSHNEADETSNFISLCSLNSKKSYCDSYDSNDDFHGFDNNEHALDDTDSNTALNINFSNIQQSGSLINKTENPACSTNTDIKTISFKPTEASRESKLVETKMNGEVTGVIEKKCDKKLVNEDVNIFGDFENDEWNGDSEWILNFQTPTSVNGNAEIIHEQDIVTTNEQEQHLPALKTASGKNIHISKAAKKRGENFLKEFACNLQNTVNHEEELRGIKSKAYEKTHNLQIKSTPLNGEIQLDADIEVRPNCEKNLVALNQKTTNKNIEIVNMSAVEVIPNKNTDIRKFGKEKERHLCYNIGSQALNDANIKMSIKTPTDKPLVLEGYKNKAMGDYLEDIKFIKDEVNNRKSENKCGKSRKNLSEKYKNEHKVGENNFNMDMECHTERNKKEIWISPNAQQIEENIFKEFQINYDIKNYKNHTKENSNSVEIALNESQTNVNAYNKHSLVSETISGKRKNDFDKSGLESSNTTDSVKKFKNGLQSSKSENSLTSPITPATRPEFFRNNLLSLTKARKRHLSFMSTQEIPVKSEAKCNLNVNTVTPTKSYISLKTREQTPITPNINEFFSSASLTSTPHINKPDHAIQTEDDADLKPIIWNNNNDYFDKKPLNISFNSSLPTIKKRPDRLSAPSDTTVKFPILIQTNNNCRPPGLRRRRSMLKKTDK